MSDASVCALSIQVVRPLVIKHANYGMSLKLACRQTSDENITMNCEAAWRAKDFDAYIAEHRFFVCIRHRRSLARDITVETLSDVR